LYNYSLSTYQIAFPGKCHVPCPILIISFKSHVFMEPMTKISIVKVIFDFTG